MSLLGFNFSFGARDDGFASALGRAGHGLKGVTGQVDSLAKKVTSGDFFNAFQTLQLDSIGDQLARMNNQGGQLETSLEGTFRSMSAEIRPMLAQLGLTGKEFEKANSSIISTADALNVGAGEVAESFRAIRRAGDQTQEVFKKMGVGMKELTLIQKATGLGAEEVSALVRNLTESYGFTTDETASFLDNFTNLTQGLGIADIAFGSLQDTMSTLDDTLSSNTQFMAMSRDEQAKHVQDQVMGVQKLTKAFMGLGKTPKEAQSAAMEFFKTISKERKSVDGMTIGIGDMGELFHSLAEEAGFKNVENLFSNISGDPTEALQQIVGMQEELAKAGDPAKLARFNSKLQEMMGGLAFMKDAGKGFTDRLAKVNEATGKTGDGLVGMAKKAHHVNRGLDEVLSRMEDRFERNLLKLTGNTRSLFVQNQKDMYKTVGEQAKELGSDKTWGGLFKQFVAARKVGATAFFMPMQRGAEQTETALKNVGKAVGKGGILGRFDAIKSAGIAGFFMDLDSPFKSNAERLEEAETEAKKYGAQLQALGLTAETIKPALMALGTAFAGLFVFVKSASAITSMVAGLGTALSVLGTVAGTIGGVLGAIASAPIVVAAAMVGAVYALGEGIKWLANAPQEFFDMISESIDSVSSYLDDAFRGLMNIDVGGMTNDFLDLLEDWVNDVFKGLGDFFSSPSKWQPVLLSIGKFFGKLGLVVVAGIAKLGEFFYTLGSRIVSWMGEGISLAFNGLHMIFDATIGKLGRWIWRLFKEKVVIPVVDIGTSIKDAIMTPINEVIDWWKTDPISTAWKNYVIDPFSRYIDSILDMFTDFFNEFILESLTDGINKMIDLYNYLADKTGGMVDRMERVDFTIETTNKFSDTMQPKVSGRPLDRDINVSVDSTEGLKQQKKTNQLLTKLNEKMDRPNGPNPAQAGRLTPARQGVK